MPQKTEPPSASEKSENTNSSSGDHPRSSEKSLKSRFASLFTHEPKTREELDEVLRHALERKLFDSDAFAMIEGALTVSELSAADLMVPRAQMEVIDLSEPRSVWLPKMIAHGHSRFPVVDGDIDEIKGVLHAKDLLRLIVDPQYDMRAHLRAPRFIPETQPLNVLLRDFRQTRNHMALVIDEFGCISGLITIEDVLEQIVGEIDDEFDKVGQGMDDILKGEGGAWRVKAEVTIDKFNEFFESELTDDYCETIGGMVTDRFEHVPRRGESIEIDGFRFHVVKADARQAHLFFVEPLSAKKQEN